MAGSQNAGTGARRDGRFDLALGLGFAIALNLPYFDARIVGINDTLYNFANFNIFYSELFFRGDLARWLPYGTYGLQADYEQIASLAPTSYLAAALGVLFRVTDALWLFKLAVLGEQLLFVFGIWRLARRLFATPATVRLLCIAAAGTSVWYAQQWWDLRIYALLPLLLSFLFAFIETRRPAQLWLAGLTGVVWCLGGLPYWIPLWLLVLAIVGALAVREWRATLRALFAHDARDLAALATFAVAAGAYAWFVLHALDGTVLRAFDRDPLTGKVDLENFRSYGGNADLVVVAKALLFGWPIHLPWGSGADNSVYLGLVPVLGLGVALLRERSRAFLALMAGALALVWLAMGGFFTELVYQLPGFAYYRHVGLTFGIVKVLLLVASGYGLERIFAKNWTRHAKPLVWAVVAALLVDLSLYQLAVLRTRVPRIEDASLLAATVARPPHYDPERRDPPRDPAHPGADPEAERASARAIELTRRSGSREIYWYVYPFSQLDPCHPALRTDYFQAGVDRLLALERAGGRGRFDALLGCGVPKLRVVGTAHIARSTEEARDHLREAVRAGDARPTVIQLAAASEAPPAEPTAPGSGGRASVQRFSLAELVVDVEVDAKGGAWLVYDDAFHEDWRASVDGAETPVHVANLAWKAVRVPPGRSTVRFWFHHGANHALGTALALFGLASGAGLVGWMVASLVPTRRVRA